MLAALMIAIPAAARWRFGTKGNIGHMVWAHNWEWYDDPSAPLSPGADAFRLGGNAAPYAPAH
jgi:hypothetical protein